MSTTPYLETWLRRTRRQLATSGTLAQVATVLAVQDEVPASQWEQTLRSILDGSASPGVDVLTRIESVLSAPSSQPPNKRSTPPSGDQMEFI